jgi:hypothetical protein
VDRYFHEVLHALSGSLGGFYNKYVRLPTSATPQSPVISLSPKFSLFFDKAVGTIDGTHIPEWTSLADRIRYRNRKGFVSQNVLSMCNFDLEFTYGIYGWEGSAADSCVQSDANDLLIPDGCFVLTDAGFALSEKVLVPYCGVQYHLQEWGHAKKK